MGWEEEALRLSRRNLLDSEGSCKFGRLKGEVIGFRRGSFGVGEALGLGGGALVQGRGSDGVGRGNL